eukprot:1155981-Pelagomonas_calceolata.AAC.6
MLFLLKRKVGEKQLPVHHHLEHTCETCSGDLSPPATGASDTASNEGGVSRSRHMLVPPDGGALEATPSMSFSCARATTANQASLVAATVVLLKGHGLPLMHAAYVQAARYVDTLTHTHKYAHMHAYKHAYAHARMCTHTHKHKWNSQLPAARCLSAAASQGC